MSKLVERLSRQSHEAEANHSKAKYNALLRKLDKVSTEGGWSLRVTSSKPDNLLAYTGSSEHYKTVNNHLGYLKEEGFNIIGEKDGDTITVWWY